MKTVWVVLVRQQGHLVSVRPYTTEVKANEYASAVMNELLGGMVPWDRVHDRLYRRRRGVTDDFIEIVERELDSDPNL